MARELSQAEVLDFLCQAGGRAANAALLGHFRGFLRDPGADPGELQRRRELFKGFVNSVATVRQEEEEARGPAAAAGTKYVVLRKRYRELAGEEPKAPAAAAEEPPPPREVVLQSRAGPRRAPGAQGRSGGGGACRRAPPPPRDPGRTCPEPAHAPPDRRTSRIAEACDPLGAEDRLRRDELRPRLPEPLPGVEARPPPPVPVVVEAAAPPQQRIRDWVATHHGGAPEAPAWSAPGDSEPPGEAPGTRPVFRSIRCQLSLQDLEDGLEQESGGSSDGEGERGVLGRLLRRHKARGGGRKPTEPEEPGLKAHPNVPGSPYPGKEGVPRPNGAVPESHTLLGWIAGRAFPSGKPWARDPEGQDKYLPETKKVVARLPPHKLDGPLSPRLVPRQGQAATSTLEEKGLSLDAEDTPEPRPTLVPLEPREHAWLVKVATGSWMQARALLLEDPHLATRKDFVSGFTVLHWLAKHGNAQVLVDFVAGARKAGVTLDVNAKSGCGYTPLHLAAMHGHQLVMKVLVQKLQCHVQARDSSGRRPWQYLSSATSGEVWQLLGAPRGKTIFPSRPIARNSSPPVRRGRSPELVRKISRKASLAAYLKPQHIKWKMANKCPPLQEREECSD